MKAFFEEKLEYFSGDRDQTGYWDYHLIDVNPSNGYEISYSEGDDEWYGHLLSNVTPEGEVTVVRELTAEEIAFCIELIPAADVPTPIVVSRLDETLARNAELEVLLDQAIRSK